MYVVVGWSAAVIPGPIGPKLGWLVTYMHKWSQRSFGPFYKKNWEAQRSMQPKRCICGKTL